MAKKNSTKKLQINLRSIKLSKKSRQCLKKIKNVLYGNVAASIEFGDWYVPSNTYEFIDVKTAFEKSMVDFFDLPEDAIVEVDSYQSDIMSFEKGIYPK